MRWPVETLIVRDFRTGYVDGVVGRPGLHRSVGNAVDVRDGLTQLLLDRRAEIAERVDAWIGAEADSRCRFACWTRLG